jgi:hypothetical protein
MIINKQWIKSIAKKEEFCCVWDDKRQQGEKKKYHYKDTRPK